MRWNKSVGSLILAFLLGVATPVLVFFGIGGLGNEADSGVFTIVAVVTLMLIAAALFRLTLGAGEKGRRSGKGAPPAERHQVSVSSSVGVELPTMDKYYWNTPDGYLGRPRVAHSPDFDPASNPAPPIGSDELP